MAFCFVLGKEYGGFKVRRALVKAEAIPGVMAESCFTTLIRRESQSDRALQFHAGMVMRILIFPAELLWELSVLKRCQMAGQHRSKRYLFLPLQIWNHPDVLYEALQKENLANEQDLDVDDLGTASSNSRCQPQGVKVKTESNALASPVGEATNSKFLQSVGFNPFQERANQVVTYEWVSTTAGELFVCRVPVHVD